MKHSVLFTQNGSKIFHRCNKDVMPNKDGGMEAYKDYMFWNTATKIAIVEKQNESDFEDLIDEVRKKGETGVDIPYEILEFYFV